MKLSELMRDQNRVIKNAMPEALKTVRGAMAMALDSPVPEFVEMGRELASKEAVFMAMGAFQCYFDMMDLVIKIIDAAERSQENQDNG